MIKFIKELSKENGVIAIIFGFIATIWLSPIAIVFILIKVLIEWPIKYIVRKIKK
tara:strand:- start:83 stop:247 length:165 start_codon:yes stop_codon:yes gene_type:complete